jgi:glycosyltransferase domain-containing protein
MGHQDGIPLAKANIDMPASDRLLTIVIPTRNRPGFLYRLLSYLQAEGHDFEILIADSSDLEALQAGRRIVERLGIKARYLVEEYDSDPKMPAYSKLYAAAQTITTPFVCVLADDDIVDIEVLRRCITVLDENRDYSLCHGKYVGFTPENGQYALTHVEYGGTSFESDDPAIRISDFLMSYEAIFYSVFRTETLRIGMEFALRQRSPVFAEIMVGYVAVLSGKVKRLPDIFAYRWPQIGSYDRNFYWEPQSYLEEDTQGFFTDLWHFRDTARTLWAQLDTTRHLDPSPIEKSTVYSLLGYIYLDIDFDALGKNTLPDPVYQCLRRNFRRRPMTYNELIPVGRGFLGWCWKQLTKTSRLRLQVWRSPKRVGALDVNLRVGMAVPKDALDRAAVVFSKVPFATNGTDIPATLESP